MDLTTLLLVVIAMAALAFLVLLGLTIVVAIRYRPSIVGILALLGGTAWVGSPVDPLPEALLGPFGLADDVAVIAAMVLYVSRLAARRHLTRAGGGTFPAADPAYPRPHTVRGETVEPQDDPAWRPDPQRRS